MPFINISISGVPLTKSQKQNLFNETTRLMEEVMNKNPDLTSVRIDQFKTEDWAIAKELVQTQGKTAVHMDIKVTKGTNTDREKAEMIKSAMNMLKAVVGTTPEASYIIIHELDATTWGYNGMTQATRSTHQP